MKMLVDPHAVKFARLINSATEFGPRRYYYEIQPDPSYGRKTPPVLLRTDGWAIEQLRNAIVEAQTGYDTAMPGFTADEAIIGLRRGKITIRRPLKTARYEQTLSQTVRSFSDVHQQ